jgi:hypothetical protein
MAPRCHRYSCVTCPNRRSRCLSLNLPISKSVVRLNATDPAWPNTFQSPCALYRGGRARAVNGLTSSNAAIDEIKRQCHEKSDFGHTFPLCKLLTPGGIAGDLNRREAPRFLVYCARSPAGWDSASSWSSTAPRSRISNQPPHASQLKNGPST